ncbi:hypothetical protein CANARDRAFT_7157 [[Candida] arabinofermentans NRRL YB-2248]|uniref:1-phosphatidylinositol 4-kinase n=1 Tax=[Candida] arabinofermentans NRRL YB-2248 TaxID=983967 RepID=A0A1E4T210_9ASCO|nr:hypothetical protein CANARDRAFT_7157 [[Candida] arabinofermentans NRRL YB-2248]
MDFIGIPRGAIRGKALEKLAQLSAKKTPVSANLNESVSPTLKRLLTGVQGTDLSSSPIKHSEVETLLALCKSSGELKNHTQAEILISRFENYLVESPTQSFSSKFTFKSLFPTPWTKLTYELVVAISTIGATFPELEQKAINALEKAISFYSSSEATDLIGYFSLAGLLQGLTKDARLVTPKMLGSLISIFDETFLSNIESTIYSITESKDVDLVSNFEDYGYELSSLYFMLLLQKVSLEVLKHISKVPSDISFVDHILAKYDGNTEFNLSTDELNLVRQLVAVVIANGKFVNEGSDRVVSSTFGRRNCCYSIKGSGLDILLFGYTTSAVNSEMLVALVSDYLEQIYKISEFQGDETVEMVNSELLPSIFSSAALLSKKDSVVGLRLNKAFPSVLSLPLLNTAVVKQLARYLSYSLKDLSSDEVVSSIYGLANILFESRERKHQNGGLQVHLRPFYSISETNVNYASTVYTDAGSIAVEAQPIVYKNIISAVVEIAKNFDDESINILVITILSQKIKREPNELNFFLLEGVVGLVDIMEKREFLIVVKYFFDMASFPNKSPAVSERLTSIWVSFSEAVARKPTSELYNVYLREMLAAIIAKGDIDELEHHRSNNDVSLSASQIAIFLKPLASLLPTIEEKSNVPTDKETISLFKDAWFNLCIHGFAYRSELTLKNESSLQRIAHSSPPLASESSWNRTETSIEMNTILRRGTSKRTEKLHKDVLSSIVGLKAIDSKVFETQISRPKLMFLASNLLIETLRVESGDCSTSLEYLSDPSVAIAGLQDYMGSISFYATSQYVKRIQSGGSPCFSVARITEQLKKVLISCCHREFSLQNTAFQAADLLINRCPPILCHEQSFFSLLEILTLLFQSVVDADSNQYDPKIEFRSKITDVVLHLSDSYKWRHSTLDRFTASARKWVLQCLMRSNQDMKSLIQTYMSKVEVGSSTHSVNYGVSFALEMGGKILPVDRELYTLEGSAANQISTTSTFLSSFPWRNNMRADVVDKLAQYQMTNTKSVFEITKTHVENLKASLNAHEKINFSEFSSVLNDIGTLCIMSDHSIGWLIKEIVEIPFIRFTAQDIELGISLWLAIMKERPEYAGLVLSEILANFEETVKLRRGLFSRKFDIKDSRYNPMEYLPTSKDKIDRAGSAASNNIKPHLLLVRFFSSHFEATKYQSDHTLKMFTRCVLITLKSLSQASLHPFSRLLRFEIIYFSMSVLKLHTGLKTRDVPSLISAVFDGALSWFVEKHRTPYGNNKLKMKADFNILSSVAKNLSETKYSTGSIYEQKRVILLLLLDHEISFLVSWLNPLSPRDTIGAYCNFKLDDHILSNAFSIDGRLAINLVERYKATSLTGSLRSLVKSNPFSVIDDFDSIKYLISEKSGASSSIVTLWSTAPPIDSINLFLPPFNKDSFILQYTMRSLESFDAHLTFFYVPQIVQALRYDGHLGYVKRFILETAKVSQLFAHQIIWNMSANSYKDEDSTIPDDIKNVLDDIRDTMVDEFTPADRAYYEKEFTFFNKVTGISGKLKPYIKKSKPEKKAKIDEEMAAIEVEEGVYIPSNPDGTVVDINRKSGKPLQSHAKAPFMATFKIQKEVTTVVDDEEVVQTITQDLSAIFKVGDDCRQDVLALQIISIFRTIWADAGLDVYVFPYKVTATAPGCGIIDVLPNSISRDMLGREAVNGLYEYFITQYGPPNGPEFQKARNNFIKSLAAYSIVTYLLEIKDRHNGNIMYDIEGHILHIDFGFCFDIVPGGVKFEQSPFKLTREMVNVMGGSTETQAYKWFEELCVKSFLACRPYMNTIINAVIPMLDSGLPCFKQTTIKHLTARFVPHKSDKEAAKYMRGLIKKSFESLATGVYDEFQRLTNGIPY